MQWLLLLLLRRMVLRVLLLVLMLWMVQPVLLVLRCAAVCCHVLPCAAMCCPLLRCAAIRGQVLPCAVGAAGAAGKCRGDSGFWRGLEAYLLLLMLVAGAGACRWLLVGCCCRRCLRCADASRAGRWRPWSSIHSC